MANANKPTIAEVQASANARKAALALLGIKEEELDSVYEDQEKTAFEAKKGQLEQCQELTALVEKVRSFGAPIRITIEHGGDAEVVPTKRLTFPKSGTSTKSNGSRGLSCKVNDVIYATMAAACNTHGLDHVAKNGRVVLEKALKDGKIKSFVLV